VKLKRRGPKDTVLRKTGSRTLVRRDYVDPRNGEVVAEDFIMQTPVPGKPGMRTEHYFDGEETAERALAAGGRGTDEPPIWRLSALQESVTSPPKLWELSRL
jgi:hypothetical protein